MDLKKKVAVVTGGSSGIGKAIAIALGQENSNVIFTYNTNEKGAKETLQKIGSRSCFFKVDFHNEKDIETLFKFVKTKFKKIDILVNNSGTHHKGKDVFDLEHWRQMLQMYLLSTVHCTKRAVELMKNGGKILNISSIYSEGKACWKGLPAFGASKASINHFTQTMAKNLAPKILVNAIAPGYVQTPYWRNTPNEQIKKNAKEQLIERFILPEEIAQMAIAILKNDAMTGEVVVVDGGLSLKTV